MARAAPRLRRRAAARAPQVYAAQDGMEGRETYFAHVNSGSDFDWDLDEFGAFVDPPWTPGKGLDENGWKARKEEQIVVRNNRRSPVGQWSQPYVGSDNGGDTMKKMKWRRSWEERYFASTKKYAVDKGSEGSQPDSLSDRLGLEL